MLDALERYWPPISTALAVLIAVLASSHVVLHKRDVRSAAGWVGLIWLVPAVGAALYLLFGVNRVRRHAASLREGMPRVSHSGPTLPVAVSQLPSHLSVAGAHLSSLAEAIGRVTGRRLLGGNRVEPLVDGDNAYPAMLAAIDGAEHSIALSTYIFETRGVGSLFIDALAQATHRGVEVRVLIDDVGARYDLPRADRVLRKRGVRAESFMPALRVLRAGYVNLRSHRKILVVDGKWGFTGGINIRAGHVLADRPRSPVRDLHFHVEGPVVAQLAEVFAEDWAYTTGERLTGAAWFPALGNAGVTLARSIADGPDEDMDRFTWTLHCALACARRTVTVMTPYFLPDTALVMALNAAALRGVDVRIVVPRQSNLRLVQWAMGRQLEEVLRHEQGCQVWLTPKPFDHSKLMLVDGEWVLFGSANWDTRSLRLNFELDVECYDRPLAARLEVYATERIASAERLTLEALRARPSYIRVRDGFARLLMPYL